MQYLLTDEEYPSLLNSIDLWKYRCERKEIEVNFLEHLVHQLTSRPAGTRIKVPDGVPRPYVQRIAEQNPGLQFSFEGQLIEARN